MGEWKPALCLLCGRPMGNRAVKVGSLVVGHESRWEECRDWDGSAPFGIIMESQGRGSMQKVGEYDLAYDTEGHWPHMKARILAMLGQCVDKGWLTRGEINDALED